MPPSHAPLPRYSIVPLPAARPRRTCDLKVRLRSPQLTGCLRHGAAAARIGAISAPRRVSFFVVKQGNMIDALLSFGGQEHIPIGIEYIDKAAFQQGISVEFRGRTVKEILDAITHPVGYRWFIRGPVVLVTHDGALVGISNLLNTRILQFRIGETSMHEASFALSLHLYFVLNPNSGGIAGDSPGGNLAFRGRAVRFEERGYWLWKVLEYDRSDAESSRDTSPRLGPANPLESTGDIMPTISVFRLGDDLGVGIILLLPLGSRVATT